MEVMASVTGTMTLLLGGIAGISLLVGGIGIMNIMLVSVTERTREIGIRKAIGAGRGTIMLQFLIEAFIISLMGCGIGIFLSGLTIFLVNRIGGVSYRLSASVVVIAVAFSMFVGLVFGLYPANKAARLKSHICPLSFPRGSHIRLQLKSVKQIKAANLDTLKGILGEQKATILYTYFHPSDTESI